MINDGRVVAAAVYLHREATDGRRLPASIVISLYPSNSLAESCDDDDDSEGDVNSSLGEKRERERVEL